MQAFHPGTGMMLEFPDNTPPEEIDRHFQNAQAAMPTNAASVAQQFLNGAQQTYEQQQLAPAPVNGRGFVGLDPQQAQFMLQQRQNAAALQQQAASDTARNRLQQQQLDQNALEGEKDRSLQINLFKERFKNERDLARVEADIAKHEADMKLKGLEATREHQTKLQEMRNQAAYLRDQAKLYNVAPGGRLIDSQGQTVAENPKGSGSGGTDPNKIVGQDTILMKDPATGEDVPVRINIFANGDYGVIGPAPSGARGTGGQGSGGARGGTQDVDPLQMEKLVQDSAIATFEAQKEIDSSLTWEKHVDNTRRGIRANTTGNQFQTGVLQDEFKAVRSAELQQQGIAKDQADKLAEVEAFKRAGIRAKIVNGEVVYDASAMQQVTVPRPESPGGIGAYIDGPWSQR